MRLFAVGLVAVAILASPLHAQPVKSARITSEFLSKPDGAFEVWIGGINDRGTVVGSAFFDRWVARAVPVMWNRSPQPMPVFVSSDYFDFVNALAFDINSRGDVIGYHERCFEDDCGRFIGYVWTSKGGFQSLPDFWLPTAINDKGDVVGFCSDFFVEYACIRRSGVVVRLADRGGAFDINDRGQVVGFLGSDVAGDTLQAVVWETNGNLRVLGEGVATRINSRGDVIGYRYDESGAPTPMFWSRSGVVSKPPFAQAGLGGINARGWVIGTAGHLGSSRAFVWNPDTGALALLSDKLSTAAAINDKGDVVGTIEGRLVIWHVKSVGGRSLVQ